MSRTHRFQLWILNRQVDALLRKANRPHVQSVHTVGGLPPAPIERRLRLRYVLLLIVVAVAIYLINQPTVGFVVAVK